MKPTEPSEGIMLKLDTDNSKWYKVDCTCGSEDDSIDVFVELTDDQVIVSTFYTQKTDWWKGLKSWDVMKIENQWLFSIAYKIKELINGVIHRIKITHDVWVDGYVKYESSTIMTKQQTLNYANALIKAVDELENRKTNNESK